MKRIGIFLIVAALIVVMVGCGNGSEETNQPAIFTYADNAIVASQMVSPIGGTIEVGYSGTPIDGIQVQFPEGVLTEDTNVSLGYNTGTLTPNEGIYAGVALTIDTGDVSQFEQAVMVTVPFENIDGTPVPYYVDSDGRLHPVLLLEIDRIEKTFTFAIFHASTFTWIVSLLAGSETLSTTLSAPVIITYQTGYYPSDDGFQIVNSRSEYTEGECFGMSAFSAWYFMQKKYRHVEDDFYPSYMNVIDTDWHGHPLYGQDIIATRATLSLTQVWDTFYSGTVGVALSLSDADKWASITSAMENTAGPVLIYLPENVPILTGPHAVVAYSYDNLGHIFLCDPNHPGEEEYVEYDMSKRLFHWYGLFNDLALLGDYASLTEAPEEPLDNILKDADADFHGSGIATIDVTSHSQGQEVNERDIVLRGNIHSSQVLVTALSVSRGYTRFSTEVGYDGSFSLSVSLEDGLNYLHFTTEGKDDAGNVIEIPNSMSMLGLLIIADFMEPTYALEITSTGGGSTTPAEGTHAYDAGTVVDLVATAASGYHFMRWTGDVSTIGNVNAAVTTITMNGDYSITADFEVAPPVQYNLTTSSTSGGSVTTPGEGTFTYSAGAVVSLVATPGVGYRFVNWTGNVGAIANVNAASTTITMNGDYSITANFVRRYNLTISSTAGGTVTTPGTSTFTYDKGTVVNLVATPASGYRFVSWSGDVDTIANVNAATTTMTINGDYSITANFEEREAGIFPDPNLEAAIREAIGKPTGDIYPSDLVGLTSLDASERSIANLTGLEYCGSLTYLDLYHNQITDISPLAGLTNLTKIYLWSNQISDISPLAGLTHLTYLHLAENQITDISPLAGLTNLTQLYIWDNHISNISLLEGLTNLTWLNLSWNQITDISPLEGLTNLTFLSLDGNQISDISPLEGLTNLTQLYLFYTGISDISPLGGLTNLWRLQLEINEITDISPLEGLTKLAVIEIGANQISDISPLAGLTHLWWLRLYDNQISDISPLAGLIHLTYLWISDNQIGDISPLVANAGLGEGDQVDLSFNPLSSTSINIYIPQLQARGVSVDY
jgi:Leucine-rich repeat (LRR) protein